MKKIISWVAALSLGACTPAVADPHIPKWNTYNSMGCMMLRECKEGTEPIRSWVDLGEQFEVIVEEGSFSLDHGNCSSGGGGTGVTPIAPPPSPR